MQWLKPAAWVSRQSSRSFASALGCISAGCRHHATAIRRVSRSDELNGSGQIGCEACQNRRCTLCRHTFAPWLGPSIHPPTHPSIHSPNQPTKQPPYPPTHPPAPPPTPPNHLRRQPPSKFSADAFNQPRGRIPDLNQTYVSSKAALSPTHPPTPPNPPAPAASQQTQRW